MLTDRNPPQQNAKMPMTTTQTSKFYRYLQLPHIKKAAQKENYDRPNNTEPFPELQQGQDVLLLSPSKPNSFIQGTIITAATIPRRYIIECQGRQHFRTKQYICPLNYNVPSPIPRPPITQLSMAKPEENTANHQLQATFQDENTQMYQHSK